MPHDVEKHSHSLLPSDPELKVKALETALVKRGLIDPDAVSYTHLTLPTIVGV